MQKINQTKILKESLAKTWRIFDTSLNTRTPSKIVWDKFRKINGTCKYRMITLLENTGNINTTSEIFEDFAQHCKNI